MQVKHGHPRRPTAGCFLLSVLSYVAVSTPLLYFRTFYYPVTNSVHFHSISVIPYLTLSNGETTLLLNAGQGTTGTRTIMEATCRLGIPSFHYLVSCGPYQPFWTKSDEHITQYNLVFNEKRALHEKIMEHWLFYRECAYPRRPSWWQQLFFGNPIINCTMERLEEVWDENKVTLIELLKQPGNFALHDSPYPYFLDYMIHLAQVGDTTNNLQPRSITLMLSEREDTIWSSRRIGEHPEVPVCREQFHEIITGSSSSVEEDFYYAGAFDLIACIEQARKQDPPPKLVSDILISYRGLQDVCDSRKSQASQCHKRLVEINARAMKDYQERVKQLYKPEYTINLWNKRYTTTEIAMDMYNKIPKLQNMKNRVELVMRGGPDDGKLLPKFESRSEDLTSFN
ncbi:hypothetical protein FisN_2Lh201 [Fistulifera solaris]|uniref:Uncharacterized protein n=1 Tax=Fistulifera solaris TaxID=1519565 RepID=A0A1Z5KF32_FISSO|nr:hypothetical protein FisN_2Lh201 [Fistulifera solaris]|eukprot:GAX24924.1 hypothetical protein FisN_2Lh201 [Fistulifera solaris]